MTNHANTAPSLTARRRCADIVATDALYADMTGLELWHWLLEDLTADEANEWLAIDPAAPQVGDSARVVVRGNARTGEIVKVGRTNVRVRFALKNDKHGVRYAETIKPIDGLRIV